MLLKGSAECVYLCECGPSRVCFRRVLHCFIEQDGAPPALIPLLFIGLDGPGSNCIKAPLHCPTAHVRHSPQRWLHVNTDTWKTPGEESFRWKSYRSSSCYRQLCSWVDGCVRWGEKGESQWQKLQGGGIWCSTFKNGDLAGLNSDHAPHSANRRWWRCSSHLLISGAERILFTCAFHS